MAAQRGAKQPAGPGSALGTAYVSAPSRPTSASQPTSSPLQTGASQPPQQPAAPSAPQPTIAPLLPPPAAQLVVPGPASTEQPPAALVALAGRRLSSGSGSGSGSGGLAGPLPPALLLGPLSTPSVTPAAAKHGAGGASARGPGGAQGREPAPPLPSPSPSKLLPLGALQPHGRASDAAREEHRQW